MDAPRLDRASLHPLDHGQRERQRAAKVADQFEAVFVRTMVASLRQTAVVGGGGMFGSGPGADVYADWFDQNLAEQIGRSGHVGIAAQLLRDFERAGALDPQSGGRGGVDDAAARARTAAAAADRLALTAVRRPTQGGIDVVR